MNVYAFYNKMDNVYFDNDYVKIIELWKHSWSKHGWNPIILNLEDAKKHKKYIDYSKKVLSYPTIHGKTYSELFFLRWLAIANVGGWYTDVDMINMGFKPIEDLNKIISCSFTLCPSVIYMNKEQYEYNIVDQIYNYDFSENDVYDRKDSSTSDSSNKYTSDMLILHNKKTFQKIDINLNNLIEYNTDIDYSNYSIIHFHGGCMHTKQKSRSLIIQEFINKYDK